MKKIFLATLFLILNSQVQASPLDYDSAFKCDGTESFNWYCKEEKKPEVKKEPQPKPTPKETPSPVEEPKPAELVEHQKMKEKLEELLKIAYVNPTEENLKNYIAYQNMVTQKAAIFTDKWKRVLWQNPNLDYQQKFPTASMAKQTKLKMLSDEEKLMYSALKEQGYGLFFFYRSDCPYCHQMASPLRIFSMMTQMDVLPISIDGVLLNDKFPGSIPDAGQAKALNVTNTPTTFLVNTKTKDIINIATGWVSTNELKNRIFTLVAKKPGESY